MMIYLDTSRNDRAYQRTGVRPANISDDDSQHRTHNPFGTTVQSSVHTEQISESDRQAFLREYVFINGVSGFEESNTKNKDCRYPLIQRILYPDTDSIFACVLKENFELCAHCGKCQKLPSQANVDFNNAGTKEEQPIRLSHGIFLHSWRYFHPTSEHTLLEARLPGEGIELGEGELTVEGRSIVVWWPVQTTRPSVSADSVQTAAKYPTFSHSKT